MLTSLISIYRWSPASRASPLAFSSRALLSSVSLQWRSRTLACDSSAASCSFPFGSTSGSPRLLSRGPRMHVFRCGNRSLSPLSYLIQAVVRFGNRTLTYTSCGQQEQLKQVSRCGEGQLLLHCQVRAQLARRVVRVVRQQRAPRVQCRAGDLRDDLPGQLRSLALVWFGLGLWAWG